MINNTKHPALCVINEVKKAVIGKDECIAKIMTAILAGGHILIEDIPGVGKTTMALAFSRALNLEQHRIQFTPDVLPADIVGFSLYQKETGKMVYQPGAVMCNLFLGDEINRTSPKTQSALLEVMEERKVTVDHITRELPKPFIVMATQNPVGSAGTFMLPESQLDRFMICISIGYPDIKQELEIVKGKIGKNPLEQVNPVVTREQLLKMQDEICEVYIHDNVYEYMGKLVEATRNHPLIELGISPRGTIALAKMTQALAYLRGRGYAVPDDICDVFLDVEAHRIRLNDKARFEHITSEDVLKDIMKRTKKPSVIKKYKE